MSFKYKDNRNIYIGGGVTVFIVASTFLWATFHTKAIVCEVQLHEWQRNIDIEDFQPRRHTHDWSYPSDAYDIHEYEEDSSYYDDKGDYVLDSDTYYDYTVDRWAYSKTLSRYGNDKEPLWPSLTNLHIQNTPSPQYGHERESGRTTTLFIHLFHKKTNTTYRAEIVNREQWDRIDYGQVVTAHVNHFGTVRRVTDAQ